MQIAKDLKKHLGSTSKAVVEDAQGQPKYGIINEKTSAAVVTTVLGYLDKVFQEFEWALHSIKINSQGIT